jgi:hypothetical protein
MLQGNPKTFCHNKTEGEILYWFTYTTGLCFLLQACLIFWVNQ